MEFKEYSSANRKLMNRMGVVIVNNKADFIDMLDASNVNFSGTDESELVSCYVDELPYNSNLQIMTSYLLEDIDKSNFSGNIENHDVYENYKNIFNYWDFDGEENSNAGGLVAGSVGAVANLGATAIQSRQNKKFGAINTAKKQEETKNELIKSIIAQKQAKIEADKKKAETISKNSKYWIIGGSIVGALTVIGLVIYLKRGK
jgi:hypothetical protein